MDLLQHLAGRDQFAAKMVKAESVIGELGKTVQDLLQPLPGPFLLFNHIASTQQRSREIKFIVDRLYETRIALLQVNLLEDLTGYLRGPGGAPMPKEALELYLRSRELDGQVQLDFQAMLIFTGIALDDWAHLAGHVLGVPNPTKSTYDRIAKDDGVGPYRPLWEAHKNQLLWLDAFPRLYRNKMIVHRERPWEMGHMHSVTHLDWSFWTPIAVGWAPEERVDEVHAQLARMLPDWEAL